LEEEEELKVTCQNNSSCTFVPLDLFKLNVGQNEDLVKVLHNVDDTFKSLTTRKNYTVGVADVNIFWRTYKVCQKNRPSFFPNLYMYKLVSRCFTEKDTL
jgi:hypothetical protein